MSDDERDPSGGGTDDERTPRPLSALAAFGWSCVGVFFAMSALFVSLSMRPGLSLDIVNNIACSALGFTIATILVLLSKHWDLHQKLFHIAIIWALPLLGAFYARFALNAAERNALEERAKQAREQPPSGA